MKPFASMTNDEMFLHWRAEAFLVERLGPKGRYLYEGVATPDVMRERLRKAILEARMEDKIIGLHRGKPETFSKSFARLYGEPLEVRQMELVA